jgi:hypothetical protein
MTYCHMNLLDMAFRREGLVSKMKFKVREWNDILSGDRCCMAEQVVAEKWGLA